MIDLEVCRERIISDDYRDFIIPKEGGRGSEVFPDDELCTQKTGAGYDIIYVDQAFATPLTFERFTYNSIPCCYAPIDIAALSQAGITQIQNFPTLQLMGNNIMIGFVDTGIDYTHPAFRNIDGTTRIAGIWDQSIQTGTLPNSFAYGSAYTQEQINEALKSAKPEDIVPSMDTDGHGTFLASIAAGSGEPNERFVGAAPMSTLAVVKLKDAKSYLKTYYYIPQSVTAYQENDIMLGIRYLLELADEYGMPIVICIAMGNSLDSHDGTSPLTIVLEKYSNLKNRGIIIGTGNEASRRHHYFGIVEAQSRGKEVEIRVGEGVEGFIAELWIDIPNLVTVSLLSPSGERAAGPMLKQQSSGEIRFIFEGTTVYIDNRIFAEKNQSQLVFFRFSRPVSGIWKIIVEPVRIIGGEFHIWLPMQEFLSGEVYFLEADPNTTLTAPASTRSAITVAYYNSAENSVDINSGRGYTRGGIVKPDFAAPGVMVRGAAPGGRYTVKTGSSVAVGITAGAAALLLEWILYRVGETEGIDTILLKSLFILGARQRPDMIYPNKEWGYGTLDLYQTLNWLRQL